MANERLLELIGALLIVWIVLVATNVTISIGKLGWLAYRKWKQNGIQHRGRGFEMRRMRNRRDNEVYASTIIGEGNRRPGYGSDRPNTLLRSQHQQ